MVPIFWLGCSRWCSSHLVGVHPPLASSHTSQEVFLITFEAFITPKKGPHQALDKYALNEFYSGRLTTNLYRKGVRRPMTEPSETQKQGTPVRTLSLKTVYSWKSRSLKAIYSYFKCCFIKCFSTHNELRWGREKWKWISRHATAEP